MNAVSQKKNYAKPHQLRAARERIAKAEFYTLAKRIPNNAVLTNILLAITERPIREGFYRNIVPHLKFKPIELEDLSYGC